MHHRLPVRQLTGAALAIPVAFAASGVMRALWAMRRACRATFEDALTALRIWFALSWVVTLACLRGLVQQRAQFLRTPKTKTPPSDQAPFSGPQQDLPRIGSVAPNLGIGPTPTPSPSPAASATPSAVASPTPSAAPSATPTPVPTPTAVPPPSPT